MTTSAHNTLRRYIDGELAADEQLQALLPQSQECCELLVTCRPGDYCASTIARCVEDCDACLISMSLTGMCDSGGNPVVLLRANARTPDGIARSLERYGYDVLWSRGELSGEGQSKAMARVNELLHYLEL